VSLIALTQRIHPEGAILPEQNILLLMDVQQPEDNEGEV
jgi:hypothetical protein